MLGKTSIFPAENQPGAALRHGAETAPMVAKKILLVDSSEDSRKILILS
jgi:hypothetical protein